MAQNIVEKSGSWYSFKGERIGHEKARQFLRDEADILETIDIELRKMPGLASAQPPVETAPGNGRNRG